MAKEQNYGYIFNKVFEGVTEFADNEGHIPESYIVDELELAFEINEINISESKFDDMLSELISTLELNGYIII